MYKTERFLANALVKGIVDEYDKIESGCYTVGKGNVKIDILSNGTDRALIRNGEKLVEVRSGRLDDILHRYIMCSLFGAKAMNYFILSSHQDNTILIDPDNNKWMFSGVGAEAAKMYFTQFINTQSVDAVICSERLVPYNRHNVIKSEMSNVEDEVLLLSSDLNPDDYAVLPSSSAINAFGNTIVNSFYTSSSDRLILNHFNKQEMNMFGIKSGKNDLQSRRKLTSSTKREANPLRSLLNSADMVSFNIDNSQKLRFEVSKNGMFSARFTAIPDVEVIRNALAREGFAFDEIQSGLTVEAKNSIVSSIINSSHAVKALEEEATMNCSVKTYTGSEVTSILKKYKINDETGVFSSIDVVRIQ